MRKIVWLLAIVAFVTYQPLRIYGQAVASARIGGQVTDPQGHPIVDAQVTARQTTTGFTQVETTNSDGIYAIPNLPVGSYTLQARASGFSTFVRSGIILEVSNNLRVDIPLQIGNVSQRVEVSATSTMINTVDNSISQVIGHRMITDLPLNGRQATQLILLSGGAVNAPSSSLVTSKNYPSSVTISVAGGAPTANNFLMDGADNNDAFTNVNLPYPFPDAIQEFSVQTNGLNAEYGLHPGSVVNVVTKSGTNNFHGTLFEFFRNGALDARNYFAPVRDQLKRNQFGGAIGGPIVKNKLLFFAGYQGTVTRTAPETNTAFVPTAAVLSGDLSTRESGGCQSSGNARTIVNPATGQPFTSDFVDPSTFNPQALAILKFVPVSTDPCGKLLFSIPEPSHENQFIGRIDWFISPKQSFFGRYFITRYAAPPVFDGNILTTSLAGQLDHDQSLVLGDTYSFNSNLVNTVHIAGSRLTTPRTVPPNAPSMTDLGINISQQVPHFTQFSVTGAFSTGCGSCTPISLADNSFQATDDVDLVKGKNQLAFGVNLMHWQLNSVQQSNSNGSFSFNGQFTNDPLLDFLLGSPSAVTQGQGEYIYFHQNYVGLYAQDTLRASKRLTINAGLRWEPFLPETDDRLPGTGDHFDPQAFAAGTTSTVFVNAPPGLTFFGDPGMPRGFGRNRYSDFEPRIGFAFDPTGTGRQSIRAAYGLFYDTPFIFYNAHMSGSSPFSANITVNAPSGGLTNPYASYPGGNPFPFPYPPDREVTFPKQASYVTFPLDLHPTYVHQFNVSYELQLAANWSLSATYLGNVTRHIWVGTELNPATYIPGTCGGKACSTTANTNQRRSLYLQHPVSGTYYASIGEVLPEANASYNGLLLKLQHRFSQNFSLISVYTHSHCISEGEVTNTFTGNTLQNPANLAADRGNCAYDVRNVFTTSLVAITPSLHSRAADRILGRWQFSPIVTARSGYFFTPTTGKDASLTGVGLDRPNVVGNPYPAHQTIQDWIQPSAFVANGPGTYGDAGVYSLEGPGSLNVDFALSRIFAIHGEQRLQARFEAFNALNHANFSNPTSSLASSQFGKILSAADPRILQLALKYSF